MHCSRKRWRWAWQGLGAQYAGGSRPGTASVGGVELMSWAEANGQPVAYSAGLPPPPSQQGFFPPHEPPPASQRMRARKNSGTFGMMSRPGTATLDTYVRLVGGEYTRIEGSHRVQNSPLAAKDVQPRSEGSAICTFRGGPKRASSTFANAVSNPSFTPGLSSLSNSPRLASLTHRLSPTV